MIIHRKKLNQFLNDITTAEDATTLSGLLSIVGLDVADFALSAYNDLTDHGVKKSKLEILIDMANSGDTEAMVILGELYSKGIGVKADDQQGLSWFKKAAKVKKNQLKMEMFRLCVILELNWRKKVI